MNKTRLGVLGAAALALPMAAPAAALASSGPVDDLPTFNALFETFNEGGAHLGGGAAELVSSAVVGVPDLALSLPEFLVGPGAPKQTTFSSEETIEQIEPTGDAH